ncbi:MAG: uracil-DNA glycosylase [Nitrosomonas sp.]|jgi:uracil-DNA glycosylase family 4|uniref:uracil-DNA glycosylase n=1 Tax=Nitrosomonas sp. TaxID=42353 RepID=UPI00272FC574|nr:uracil-DNA glycosylase [Nitrosomonas sp.]MDP1549345.1 uracil-DNA glycosylase [Nitrosomonas sp.]
MNTRRRQILKELNLLPVWQLKSGARKKNQLLESQSIEVRNLISPLDPAQDSQQCQKIHQMNWDQLRLEVSQCSACPLHQTRTQTVFGVGDKNADWLFVGEGPGATEDATGEPFVGQAGKLLDQMLVAIKLNRGQQVYITNIVKCRPPNNRTPHANEARQCEPYLTRQIALIKPKLIVALGKVAAQNLLQCGDSISSLRGKIHDYSGIPLIVTYHPAYLLRALPEKAKAWKDLCFAQSTMHSIT